MLRNTVKQKGYKITAIKAAVILNQNMENTASTKLIVMMRPTNME